MMKRRPIQVEEAVSLVLEKAEKGKIHPLSLFEANGHFLGEDLMATHPMPPFDRSPYDGFAVRSEDTVGATTHSPNVLQVIGEVAAGDVFAGTVKKNEAVRIMTGGQIPQGADAVIMLEAVKE